MGAQLQVIATEFSVGHLEQGTFFLGMNTVQTLLISSESEESYIDSVIGCFTSASFDKEEQLPTASIIESQQTTEDAGECLDYCSDSMYAVFVVSLGIEQRIETHALRR